MVVGDGLAALTSPGYLNQIDLQSNPVSPSDVLQVMYDFVPATQSGNFGSFTVSISNGIITLSPLSLSTTLVTTLTPSQMASAYSSPQLLVPAPGAGKTIICQAGYVYTNVSTPFSGGGVGIIQYGTAVHGLGSNALGSTISAAEITSATSLIYTVGGSPTSSVNTSVTNQGLYFSNTVAPFAGGNNSSVTFTIQYMALNGTV
jgi:hypothetical protein